MEGSEYQVPKKMKMTIEEETTSSLVFFCTSINSKNYEDWYAVDTNKGTCSKIEEISKEGVLPHSFGCAIFKSRIYIVGGSKSTDSSPTNQVLVFDTSSKELKVAPSMIHPRVSPLVVAAGNELYVFGGYHLPKEDSPKPWAEYFNGHKWDKIPTDPPPEISRHDFYAHAVYGGDIIIIWNEYIFSSYCVSRATWNFFCLPLSYYHGEFTCLAGSVAVMDHTMYSCFGDLFAFDLQNLGSSENPIYTFDHDSTRVPSVLSRLKSSLPQYVVPTGKKHLCLLWFDPAVNKNELKVSWMNFQTRTKDSSVVPMGDPPVATVDGNYISQFLGVLKQNDDQGRRDINLPDDSVTDISCERSYLDPQNLLVNLSKTMFVTNYNIIEKLKKRNFVAATAEGKLFLIDNSPMQIIPLKAKIEMHDLLQENDVTEYAKIFDDEEIDVIALMHFTSKDFDTLKIPLVARNKLVHALRTLNLRSED